MSPLLMWILTTLKGSGRYFAKTRQKQRYHVQTNAHQQNRKKGIVFSKKEDALVPQRSAEEMAALERAGKVRRIPPKWLQYRPRLRTSRH